MDGVAQSIEPLAQTALGGEQLQVVDRALRRLHESLREFCGAWPVSQRTPLHLSRDLKIDRTTCQRVTSLAKAQYTGFGMLDTMPGPRALRKVLEACKHADRSPSAQVLAGLNSAVDGLEEVISGFGSLSELKRKIAAIHLSSGSATSQHLARPNFTAQEAYFNAASSLTGRRALVATSIGLYDKVDVGPDEMRHLRISGSCGVVARPDALPMVFEAFDSEGAEEMATESDTPQQRWQRRPALLHEFTTANWRTVELPASQGFASRAMEVTPSREPSDVHIYTAFPVPDPQAAKGDDQSHGRPGQDLIEESWFILYNPAAALIFDLYLHESIARRCLLSLDIHAWQTSFANAPHGRWHTRMPQSPPIMQIGRGIPRSAAPETIAAEHPLQVQLIEELFRRAGTDPAEYIGFRCEERFPMWRTGYRFELDFGRAE